MASLVHQSPAIELPFSTPGHAIVVFLRPGPEYIYCCHVDTPKTVLFYGSLSN